jgi:hypothetical protein
LREIDKIMQSFNPFHIEKPLDRTASKVWNVSRLNGTILAEQLMKAKMLGLSGACLLLGIDVGTNTLDVCQIDALCPCSLVCSEGVLSDWEIMNHSIFTMYL